MKFSIDRKLWDKANILAKACFIVGLFLVDLAMKLSGFEEAKK